MKLEIYSLIGCYFSSKAEYMVTDLKLKNKIKIIKVKCEEKDKYKKKNNMDTFPQIFVVNGKKRFKIGGSTDLENCLRIIDEIKNNNIDINSLCMFNTLINEKSKNSKNSKNSKKNK